MVAVRLPEFDQLLDRLGFHIRDVGDAPLERIHFSGVGIESRHLEPGFAEHHRQRQPHVAKPQDANSYIFFS